MDVLQQIDDWPVEVAAVAVTGPQAAIASHGPVDRVFRLASVTKLLSAVGVLIAVQDGLIHLDEPAGPKDSTVRHLLAHASGLAPAEGGPVTAAGSRRIYSNWGYEMLGDLVAQRSGRAFAEHLRLELFEPLGMRDTRLEGSPAADAVGTIADLLRFGREILEPDLLDGDLVAEATRPQFPELDGVLPGFGRQQPNPWGLGFEIRDDKSPHWTGPNQPGHTCGHFGQSGSFLWIDRQAGLACAFLGDRDFDTWAVEAWPPFNQRAFDAATGR